MIDAEKEVTLLKWTSNILRKEITVENLKDGKSFIALLKKMDEKSAQHNCNTFEECYKKIAEDLHGFYQVDMNEMFDLSEILGTKNLSEFQTLSILLLILTYGLQSKNGDTFKYAACILSEDHQQEVMHLTEELLQSDHTDCRPIERRMLLCLTQKRDCVFDKALLFDDMGVITPSYLKTVPRYNPFKDISMTRSLPVPPGKLNFDVRNDAPPTPITYTHSPCTPLRDWLESPQMIQKSKLRMKEQELRRVRKELMEEESLRHDSEVELRKTQQELETLTKALKMMEKRLTDQIQTSNHYREKVANLSSQQSAWESQETEWMRMKSKLEEYKKKAKEARWWEKEHEVVTRERNSLRLKALALEEIRGRVKDRQQLEEQMVELMAQLRSMDDQIRELILRRKEAETESETLRQKNEELERRLSSFVLDESAQMSQVMDTTDVAGESMRVVTDLRISELESQLAEKQTINERQNRELRVFLTKHEEAVASIKQLSVDLSNERDVRGTVEQEVQHLQEIVTKEQSARSNAEEEIHRLQETVSVEQSARSNAEEEIHRLQETVSVEQSARSNAEEEIHRLQETVSVEQSARNSVEHEMQLLQEKKSVEFNEGYNELVGEKNVIEAQLKQALNARSVLELELQELHELTKSQDEELQAKLRLATGDIESLKLEIENLAASEASKLKEKEDKVAELTKRLEDASEDNRKLCEELALFHNGSEELTREHMRQIKVVQCELQKLQKEKQTKMEEVQSLFRLFIEIRYAVTRLQSKVIGSEDEGCDDVEFEDINGCVESMNSINNILKVVDERVDNLQSQVKSAVEEKENFSVQIEMKEKQIMEALSAKDLVEAEMKTLFVELEDQTNKLLVSEASAIELKANSDALRTQLEEKENDLKDLHRKLTQAEDNDRNLVECHQTEISKMWNNNQQLTIQVENLRSDLNNLPVIEAIRDQLSNQLNEALEKLTDSETARQELMQMVADYETERKESTLEIVKLQSEQDDLRQKLEERKEKEIEFSNLVTKSEKEQNDTARKLEYLEEKFADSIRNVAEAEKKLTESNKDNENTIQKLSAAMQQLEDKENKLTEVETVRNRLQTEMEYALAKADNAELCRAEEARSCESLRELIHTLEVEIDNQKLRLKNALIDAGELSKIKEERDALQGKVAAFQKEMQFLEALRQDNSRYEMEVEHLNRELQAAERQNAEITQSVESIWTERLLQVEEQNELLTQNVRQLENEVTTSRRSLRETNIKLEEEVRAAAVKLETRERKFAEEKENLLRMRDEAREMAEAYREIYDAEMKEEHEEENRKSDWNSEAMEELTTELERVKENHRRLVETHDEEMQALRREMEAVQEEHRQAEERIRSLNAQMFSKERSMRDVEEEKRRLLNDVENMKQEVTKREAVHEQSITTMNGLYARIEKLETERREMEGLRNSVRELQNIKASHEERLQSLTTSLEKSREEMRGALERLTTALRDKEEALSSREHAERRCSALIADCDDWREMGDRAKSENQRLKEEMNSMVQEEERLRARCVSLTNEKEEQSLKVKEASERAERLRKQIVVLETEGEDQRRANRARLSTAEKRQRNMETEMQKVEAEATEWRSRCQRMTMELDERMKASDSAGRARLQEMEEELNEERQSKERYRNAYSDLQNDVVRLESECAELQTANRQLSFKMRSMEMQADMSAGLKRQASTDFSPVYGNHMQIGHRAHSVTLGDIDMTPQTHNKVRRRHSSPMTPTSRIRRPREELEEVQELPPAPISAFSSLFSCEDEPNEGLEWKRIHELQKRNAQQPVHMQTSYPVETQSCDPRELATLLTADDRSSTSSLSSRKPLPDLNNPFDLTRRTTSSVSEELIRSGSTSATSNMTSNQSTSKSTENVFKMPSAPSSSRSIHQSTESLRIDEDKENAVPIQEIIPRKQSLAFEIQMSPKKQSKSGLFGQQRKQKYKVRQAEKTGSDEVQNHKSVTREEVRCTTKNVYTKHQSSHHLVGGPPAKQRYEEPVIVPETPLQIRQLPRSPVRGRRELQCLRGISQTSQPGLVDDRQSRRELGDRISQRLVSMARKMTPKRRNRVGSVPRNVRDV